VLVLKNGMKKIISIFILIINLSSLNKAYAQIDSTELLRDYVYNHRAYYIGKPFSVLLGALHNNVNFLRPYSAGLRTAGTFYYQNDVLYLPYNPNFGSSSLDFQLAKPAYVDMGQRRKMSYEAWDAKIIALLANDTLVGLTVRRPYPTPPLGIFTPAAGWVLAQPDSLTVNNGTVSVYVVLQGQPANWQTPFLIGTLSGTACLPQTVKTVSVFQGYTWGITINTDGTVYVKLVSGIAGMSPPSNAILFLQTPIIYNVP
jgi:hypothetical protein